MNVTLLYLTLKSQNVSIRNQEKEGISQRDFEFISRLVSNVRDEFDKIRIEKPFYQRGEYKGTRDFFGLRAFYEIKTALISEPISDTPGNFNHDAIKAFYFSYEYIKKRVINVLIKNLDSTLDSKDRHIFYEELKPIIEEIVIIAEASEIYLNKVNQNNSKHSKFHPNHIHIDEIGSVLSFYTEESVKKEFENLEPKM